MSTKQPTRTSSRSPNRSRNSSTKRRPLHERSDSQTNEIIIPTTRNSLEADIYSKSPFPELPSQIFSPKGSISIYQDRSASPSRAPATGSRPAKRNAQSTSRSGSTRSAKEKRQSITATPQSNGTFVFFPELRSQPSLRSNPSPRSSDIPGSLPEQGPAAKETEALLSPSPKLNSTLLERFLEKENAGPSALSAERHADVADPPEASSPVLNTNVTIRNPKHRQKRVQRLRSQSSVVSSPSTPKEDLSNVNPDTPQASDSRPRSSSSPVNPTEEFLQALIDSGTNIQYPKLKQPSVTSLRTENSSIRAAYPAPLKLQRKRANSQLVRAASGADGNIQSALHSNSFRSPRPLHYASASSLLTAEDPNIASWSDYRESDLNSPPYGANSDDENEDTITELQPPPLRRQRSAYLAESNYDSRPSSTTSSAFSQRGSFYKFLNDSYTAWAPVYYRGDGRLRSETPPIVTTLRPPATPVNLQRAGSRSTISGPSQSPDSAGFPEAIFIPRVRPLVIDPRPGNRISLVESVAPSNNSSSAEIDTILPVQDPHPIRTTLITEPFNPTKPVPHLSPDKRVSVGFIGRAWVAPSFDEHQSFFSRGNRQILLFCFGFVFPLAWMLAAILPIPPRPQWRRATPVDDVEKQTGRSVVDLFDSLDVTRYQKARWWRNLNRFMSIAGVCIIAAVIACAVVSATH